LRTWQIDELRPDIDGPWTSEPDKALWIDPATGLDCLAHRNQMGAWCGYVGVPPGHPWHGREPHCVPLSRVWAHGGVNFAGPDRAGAAHAYGLTGGPDRSDDLWWVGFDCGHADDLAPGLLAALHQADPLCYPLSGRPSPGLRSIFDSQSYRTFEYVINEVQRLAAQAHRATGRRLPGPITGHRRPHRSANQRRRRVAWEHYRRRTEALSASMGNGPGSYRSMARPFTLWRGVSLPTALTRSVARALRSTNRDRRDTGRLREP
jgi:hypothetical protein